MNKPWRDAILEVLGSSPGAMHYTEISESIAEKGLRDDFGATPANTVVSIISTSIKDDGSDSPFVRVGKGYYGLKSVSYIGSDAAESADPATEVQLIDEHADETGLINAFGMYWDRSKVFWNANPKLLGKQQINSTPVDFCNQKGVYLLLDGRDVVYVGRTTEQPIGKRLYQHTYDRLNSRWNRFSWFGVCTVNNEAGLEEPNAAELTLESLVVTLEALLIESLEPPQNRRRGDDFKAVEFLQVEDPAVTKTKVVALLEELKSKL